MVVGILTIEIEIPGAMSLKDKRSVLNSIRSRIRQKFNVAFAETDDHEIWNASSISLVTVSNEQQHVNSMLTNILNFIDQMRNFHVVDSTMEFI